MADGGCARADAMPDAAVMASCLARMALTTETARSPRGSVNAVGREPASHRSSWARSVVAMRVSGASQASANGTRSQAGAPASRVAQCSAAVRHRLRHGAGQSNGGLARVLTGVANRATTAGTPGAEWTPWSRARMACRMLVASQIQSAEGSWPSQCAAWRGSRRTAARVGCKSQGYRGRGWCGQRGGLTPQAVSRCGARGAYVRGGRGLQQPVRDVFGQGGGI